MDELMGYASDTLADRRHKEAELDHLREFYLYWAQMHSLAADLPRNQQTCQEAAQKLTEQARVLREFYA